MKIRFPKAISFVSGILLTSLVAGPAIAGPEGGRIIGGEGTIEQMGDLTRINQETGRIAINWETFNVAANETVRFVQPDSSSVALNRILDQNPSTILGMIDANGRVFLINPYGIVFGDSAQVNVAGLIASSLNISTEDFMAGNYAFDAGSTSGLVLNQGTITASNGGFVALLGEAVANEGLIVAEAGTIGLASGESIALDFDGSGTMYFEVQSEVLSSALDQQDAVRNSGTLVADGGRVLLTASAADSVFTNAINNEGVIRAGRIDDQGGVIRLVSDGVTINSGTLDASGSGGAGGSIDVLGDEVVLSGSSRIDVSGDTDGGAINVGGGRGGDDPSLLNASNTTVAAGASLSADAGTAGNGGSVIVWSNGTTTFDGHISATGGSQGGNGGFAEVSGAEHISITGHADLTAAAGDAGELLIDPGTVTICDDAQAGCVQGDPDTFTDAFISTQMAGGDLTILTENATGGAFEAEDINFVDGTIDISWGNTNTLTLVAGDNINLDGSITAAGGTLDLQIGDDGEGGTLDFGNSTIAVGTVSVTGGAGIDRIIGGTSIANDFVVNTLNAGTVNGFAFSNVEILIGGLLADTFTFNAGLSGNAQGGDGNDIFNLNGDVIDPVDGVGTRIDGKDGDDVFNVNVAQTDLDLELAGALGNDTFNLNADVAGKVNGNSGNDIINIDAAQTGRLLGGDDDDTFNLNVAFASAGTTINGNSGNDIIVARADVENTFNVTGVNVGDVNGVTFTAIEDLQGGNLVDTFNFSAVLKGTAFGGAGDDIFNLSTGGRAFFFNGGAGSDTISLANRTQDSTLAGGTLTDIEVLIGSAFIDTLSGGDGDDDFTVTAADAGTLSTSTTTTAFSGFENLSGGGGADTFNLNADVSGVVDGEGGDDVFNLNVDITGTVNGGVGNDTLVGADGAANTFAVTAADAGTLNATTFSNMENLTGGSLADTFTFDALLTGAANGGAGDDTFILNDNGGAAGIDGGAGIDTQTYANRTTAITLGLQTLNNIENVIGTTLDGDVFRLAGNVTNSISVDGGGGDDFFAVSGDSVVSGDLSVTGVSDISIVANLAADNITFVSSGDIFQEGFRGDAQAAVITAGTLNSTSNGRQIYVNVDVDQFDAISNGSTIEIWNVASGGDLRIGTINACRGTDCSDGNDGRVVIRTLGGSILAADGGGNISGRRANLDSAFGIGTFGQPINFIDFPTVGVPIVLVSTQSPFIDDGGAEFKSIIQAIETSDQERAQGSAQAGSREQSEEVDWAAYDEDITLFEINNEGIQLPPDQQIDDFARNNGDDSAVPIAQNIQN